MKTKIIANYLPQFHRIPENDKWWGEGFTDWTTVKNAKKMHDNTNQPKEPLNDNYYSLDNIDSIKWQCKLAKDNGIYGFGIYHYWFSSELCLLDKPVWLLHENKDIDMPFLLIWDNVSWKRSWDAVRFSNDWAPLYENATESLKEKSGMLAELKYGDEVEWKKHFEYLLPLMQDDRYIKNNNKPVLAIFNQDNDSEILSKMFKYWNELAIQNEFDGIEIWGKVNNRNINISDYQFNYEPHEHGFVAHNIFEKIINKLDKRKPQIYDYDTIWDKIIKSAEGCKDNRLIYGGFVNYDDTPRRGMKGKIVINSAPEKFGKYLNSLCDIAEKQGKEYIFLTAWNEWGEGAYLEPDKEFEMAYLSKVEKV